MANYELIPPVKFKMPGWDRWNEDNLRHMLGQLRPRAFQRGFRQKPHSDSDLVFPHFSYGGIYQYDLDWSKISNPISLSFDPLSEFYVDPSWPRYTGVDLSSAKRRGTVLFTIALSPYNVRHILDIRIGAWDAPEKARQIQSVYDSPLLHPVLIFVESNALQDMLRESMQAMGKKCWVAIEPYNTGRAKRDNEIGIPSIDAQYSENKWKLAIPHKMGQIIEPSERDASLCFCGRCIFQRAAATMTVDDYDNSPDVIMAQFIAKEASRRYGKISDLSPGRVSVAPGTMARAMTASAENIYKIPSGISPNLKTFSSGVGRPRSDYGRGDNLGQPLEFSYVCKRCGWGLNMPKPDVYSCKTCKTHMTSTN